MSTQPPRPRSFFRATALRHYTQRYDRTVLLRLGVPTVFRHLWLMIVLLVAGALWLAWVPVPVYLTGTAIVVAQASAGTGVGSVQLVGFLPADSQPLVSAGQTMLMAVERDERWLTTIRTVEPQLASPSALIQRFGLAWPLPPDLNQPAVVVIADFPAPSASVPPTAYLGGQYTIDVQAGSRRLLSLVPFIGHWWGN